MLNLDPGKLLVIGVVAIILLGPDRLPQVARQLGGAWRSFNEFRHRMESEVRNTMPDLPPTSEIARLARSPSALLNHLSNMSPDEDAGRVVPTTDAARTENGTADAGAADADAGCADGGPAGDAEPPDAHGADAAAHADAERRRRAPAPNHAERPHAGPPAVRRGRSRRPDPELNGTTVVTLPFTAKRKNRPSPDNMTLGEHLGELRRRVIICAIAFVVAATIAVFAYEPILHFLLHPLCSVDASTRHHTAKGTSSLLVASNGTLQPLRDLAPRRPDAAREDRALRWSRPGVADHPVPDLALRDPRPQGDRAALRHPVRAERLRALPPRRGDGLHHPAARAGLVEVRGWPEPAGDLRPDPVSRA